MVEPSHGMELEMKHVTADAAAHPCTRAAALGGGHRAAVRRQAEALDRVDVRHAGELVDLGDQEHREELIRNTDQVGEARH